MVYTFYCNYFLLLGTWGPLDFAYPAYPIVTPLIVCFAIVLYAMRNLLPRVPTLIAYLSALSQQLLLAFIYLLTEHLHFQRNITAGQQDTNT